MFVSCSTMATWETLHLLQYKIQLTFYSNYFYQSNFKHPSLYDQTFNVKFCDLADSSVIYEVFMSKLSILNKYIQNTQKQIHYSYLFRQNSLISLAFSFPDLIKTWQICLHKSRSRIPWYSSHVKSEATAPF